MAMKVRRSDTGFTVLDGREEHQIKYYDVHPFLRNLSQEKLEQYEAVGNRYRAIKLRNGQGYDYAVQPEGGLKGGGPILGFFAVAGTLVAGGVATIGAAAGGFVVGGPAGAATAGVLTAKATCAAAVYVAIATTATPTP